MKRAYFILGLFLGALPLLAAEAEVRQQALAAIQNLAGKSGYSWVSQTKSESRTLPWRQGPIEGKTEKDGYTYFRFNLENNWVEAAFRELKSAIKTETQWESPLELTGERSWIARRLHAFQAPVREAEDLLSKARRLKQERSGIISGELTPEGVKEILELRSRSATQRGGPARTKGSVKFWLQGGVLAKYEFSVQGKIVVPDPEQEFDINRTTTVEIKEIGTTKVDLPEEAKAKLQ